MNTDWSFGANSPPVMDKTVKQLEQQAHSLNSSFLITALCSSSGTVRPFFIYFLNATKLSCAPDFSFLLKSAYRLLLVSCPHTRALGALSSFSRCENVHQRVNLKWQ